MFDKCISDDVLGSFPVCAMPRSPPVAPHRCSHFHLRRTTSPAAAAFSRCFQPLMSSAKAMRLQVQVRNQHSPVRHPQLATCATPRRSIRVSSHRLRQRCCDWLRIGSAIGVARFRCSVGLTDLLRMLHLGPDVEVRHVCGARALGGMERFTQRSRRINASTPVVRGRALLDSVLCACSTQRLSQRGL